MAVTMTQAVQKILHKVGDPSGGTYCDNYAVDKDGRAKDAFWESALDIIADMYKDKKPFEEEKGKSASIGSMFTDDDIKGLNKTSSEPINSATGKILYADISNFFKFKNIFINPEGTNQLSVFLKKTNMDYFNGIKGQDLVPDDTIYWYPVGDGIIFYPKADTKFVDGEVTLEYTESIVFTKGDPDTITADTDLAEAGFVAGNYFYISDSDNNDEIYLIESISGKIITLATTDALTTETVTCTIGKCREVTVMYIEEPQISSYDGSGGDTKPLTALFSITFIYKAIELASQKIEIEKEKI